MIIEVLFWIMLILIIYPYIIYPLLLVFVPKIKITGEKICYPQISIIVPSQGEGISAKRENCLSLDYPPEKLEIIFVLDGSHFPSAMIEENARIRILRLNKHCGKTTAVNMGIKYARGEIVVLSDCDCLLEKEALKNLVSYFNNSKVGCVVGKISYSCAFSDAARCENIYWRWESIIRYWEAERGMLALGSGGFLALRRKLIEEIPADQGDDFFLPLTVIRKGYYVVYGNDIKVRAKLKQLDYSKQFAMRTRIISKDFNCLLKNLAILNPFRYGRYSFALISHKLLRWLAPFFISALFLLNLALLNKLLYQMLLVAHIAFYLAAGAGRLFPRSQGWRQIFALCYDFFLMNLACLRGIWKAVKGKPIVKWEPLT